MLNGTPGDGAAHPEPRGPSPIFVRYRPTIASIWTEMDIPERVESYLASQPEPKQKRPPTAARGGAVGMA